MAATTHIAATTPTRDRSPQRVTVSAASVSAIGAGLANLAVYGVARAADVDFTVRMSEADPWSTVSAGQVGAVSIIAVLVGAGVAWLANRWYARLLAWVRRAGIVVTVASAGPALSLAAVDDAAKPLLALMHLVAGVAFLYATRQR